MEPCPRRIKRRLSIRRRKRLKYSSSDEDDDTTNDNAQVPVYESIRTRRSFLEGYVQEVNQLLNQNLEKKIQEEQRLAREKQLQEEQLRREKEEQERLEAEQRAKKEKEERARKASQESKRRKEEEIKRREEEERKRREDEESKRREDEERRRNEEEELKRKEEEERKRREEVEREMRDSNERKKKEEEAEQIEREESSRREKEMRTRRLANEYEKEESEERASELEHAREALEHARREYKHIKRKNEEKKTKLIGMEQDESESSECAMDENDTHRKHKRKNNHVKQATTSPRKVQYFSKLNLKSICSSTPYVHLRRLGFSSTSLSPITTQPSDKRDKLNSIDQITPVLQKKSKETEVEQLLSAESEADHVGTSRSALKSILKRNAENKTVVNSIPDQEAENHAAVMKLRTPKRLSFAVNRQASPGFEDVVERLRKDWSTSSNDPDSLEAISSQNNASCSTVELPKPKVKTYKTNKKSMMPVEKSLTKVPLNTSHLINVRGDNNRYTIHRPRLSLRKKKITEIINDVADTTTKNQHTKTRINRLLSEWQLSKSFSESENRGRVGETTRSKSQENSCQTSSPPMSLPKSPVRNSTSLHALPPTTAHESDCNNASTENNNNVSSCAVLAENHGSVNYPAAERIQLSPSTNEEVELNRSTSRSVITDNPDTRDTIAEDPHPLPKKKRGRSRKEAVPIEKDVPSIEPSTRPVRQRKQARHHFEIVYVEYSELKKSFMRKMNLKAGRNLFDESLLSNRDKPAAGVRCSGRKKKVVEKVAACDPTNITEDGQSNFGIGGQFVAPVEATAVGRRRGRKKRVVAQVEAFDQVVTAEEGQSNQVSTGQLLAEAEATAVGRRRGRKKQDVAQVEELAACDQVVTAEEGQSNEVNTGQLLAEIEATAVGRRRGRKKQAVAQAEELTACDQVITAEEGQSNQVSTEAVTSTITSDVDPTTAQPIPSSQRRRDRKKKELKSNEPALLEEVIESANIPAEVDTNDPPVDKSTTELRRGRSKRNVELEPFKHPGIGRGRVMKNTGIVRGRGRKKKEVLPEIPEDVRDSNIENVNCLGDVAQSDRVSAGIVEELVAVLQDEQIHTSDLNSNGGIDSANQSEGTENSFEDDSECFYSLRHLRLFTAAQITQSILIPDPVTGELVLTEIQSTFAFEQIGEGCRRYSPQPNVAFYLLEPGSITSMRIDDVHDTTYTVLEGEMKIFVHHREFRAPEGNKFFVPKGSKHRFENVGDVLLKVYVTKS